MTTCAMSGCMEQGTLLLHMRYRKDNLLQAEYCVEHFLEQMNHWQVNVQLANTVRNHFFYNSTEDYGYERQDLQDGLRFLFFLKRQNGVTNPNFNEMMEIFREHQDAAKAAIAERAEKGHYDAVRLCERHHIQYVHTKPS